MTWELVERWGSYLDPGSIFLLPVKNIIDFFKGKKKKLLWCGRHTFEKVNGKKQIRIFETFQWKRNTWQAQILISSRHQ